MLKKKGFTLVEMIVVIAIIGILGAILIPSIMGYVNWSKKKATVANAQVIYDAAVTALATSDEAQASFYSHAAGSRNPGCGVCYVSTPDGKALCDKTGRSNKYSYSSAKSAMKSDDYYSFTVVARVDGASHSYGKNQWSTGVSNVYNDWSCTNNDYLPFVDLLSYHISRKSSFYEYGGHNEDTGTFPVKMPYNKRNDGGQHNVLRWLVVYRLDDPEKMEIWAGDGTAQENGPVYRVYPNPNKNYA